MPTFYTGYRPILKPLGGNPVNPYTGTVGTYSNWALFSKSHAFDGARDVNNVPGAGLYPGDYYMSRVYRGLENKTQPLAYPGLGPVLDPNYFRTQPLLYHGLVGAKVFP